MGLAEILQRRVKPLKFASDDEASKSSPSPLPSLGSNEDASDEFNDAKDDEALELSEEISEEEDVSQQASNHVQKAKAKKVGLRRRPLGH